MQTIEIADPLEARRCRYALYRGELASVVLNGLRITGLVRSVKEDKSSTPTRWTVTVASKQGVAA
jgi:chromosome segregation and condensation protein ScpB